MEEERNSDKDKETTKKMEQERNKNTEKQMAEQSDSEEDETSPTRWFQMVIKGKMVAKPEVGAKKLTKKEPGLGEGPVLMPDPRRFYFRVKFGPMLVGSSSCHGPRSRQVLGEHAPLVIHKKKEISKMAGRMEVGSSSSHKLQRGLVIGGRTPLLINEKPRIRRQQESSSIQIRPVEPKDFHWFRRLCFLDVPVKYRRFIKLACEEELVVGAKGQSVDSMCPFCREDVETTMHCLWECSNAILVWSTSPLSRLVLLLLSSTFRDLLCDAMTVLEDDYDLSLFVLICGCMWEARNDHEQEGTAVDPDAIVDKALQLLGKKPSHRPSCFASFCSIL